MPPEGPPEGHFRLAYWRCFLFSKWTPPREVPHKIWRQSDHKWLRKPLECDVIVNVPFSVKTEKFDYVDILGTLSLMGSGLDFKCQWLFYFTLSCSKDARLMDYTSFEVFFLRLIAFFIALANVDMMLTINNGEKRLCGHFENENFSKIWTLLWFQVICHLSWMTKAGKNNDLKIIDVTIATEQLEFQKCMKITSFWARLWLRPSLKFWLY